MSPQLIEEARRHQRRRRGITGAILIAPFAVGCLVVGLSLVVPTSRAKPSELQSRTAPMCMMRRLSSRSRRPRPRRRHHQPLKRRLQQSGRQRPLPSKLLRMQPLLKWRTSEATSCQKRHEERKPLKRPMRKPRQRRPPQLPPIVDREAAVCPLVGLGQTRGAQCAGLVVRLYGKSGTGQSDDVATERHRSGSLGPWNGRLLDNRLSPFGNHTFDQPHRSNVIHEPRQNGCGTDVPQRPTCCLDSE